MSADMDAILQRFPRARRDDLIPMLQAVQAQQGYLSEEAMRRVGAHMGLAASKVYGVATFYNQFRFQPVGRYHIQLCRGTACHVKGSLALLEAIEQRLRIRAGQTTRDGLFSIEAVACLGACGLAPVMCVNGEFHARITPAAACKLIDDWRKEAVQ